MFRPEGFTPEDFTTFLVEELKDRIAVCTYSHTMPPPRDPVNSPRSTRVVGTRRLLAPRH